MTGLPYSEEFLQDKIFTDCSKNENSRILFSRMLGQPRNPQNYCPNKISRYMVFSMFSPRMCNNGENVFHEISENFVLQEYWCMYMSPISYQDA